MNMMQTKYCDAYGSQYMTYDGDDRVKFRGFAPRNTAPNVGEWQIASFDYDANDNLLSIKWAEGTNLLWTQRGTYTYS